MKILKQNKTVHYNLYQAEDGSIFNTEYDCLEYERCINKQKTFVVLEKPRASRGETFIGVFSTKELADKWIEEYDTDKFNKRFYIREEYIDGKEVLIGARK